MTSLAIAAAELLLIFDIYQPGGSRPENIDCILELRLKNKETFKVRGEPITINLEYTKCKECGDEVLNPAIGPDPFELAYDEYRRKHALLQSEEIIKWRKAHSLSQSEFAKLTGIGVATINRYENGALQNES